MKFATQLSLRRPWLVVVAVALLAAAGTQVQHRQSVADGMRGLFEADDPVLVAYDRFRKNFDDSDMVAIGFQRDQMFTKDSLELIRQISTKLAAIDGVRAVNSLTTVSLPFVVSEMVAVKTLVPEGELDAPTLQAIKEKAASTPSLTGRLISKDGHTTVIAAEIKRTLSDSEREAVLAKISGEVAAVDRSAAQLHVSGNGYLEAKLKQLVVNDRRLFATAARLAALVALWLGLQSFWLAVVGTAFAAATGAISSGLVALWLPPVNAVTTALPIVLFSLALLAAVPALRRYRAQAARLPAGEGRELVAAVMQESYPSIWTTLLMAACGFAVAAAMPVANLRVVGLAGLLGSALTLLSAVTVLPSFLYLRARRVSHRGPPADIAGRCIAWAIDKRQAVLAASLLIVLTGSYAATTLRVDINPFLALPKSDGLRQDIDFFGDNLNGPIQVDLEIKAAATTADLATLPMLQRLESAQSGLVHDLQPDYTSALSITQYFKEMQRAFVAGPQAQAAGDGLPTKESEVKDYTELLEMSDGKAMGKFLSPDKHSARITLSRRLDASVPFADWETYLSKTLPSRLGEGLSVEEAGSSALSSHLTRLVRSNLPLTFGLAVLAMLGCVALLSRSAAVVLAVFCSMLVATTFMLGFAALSHQVLDIASLGLGVITAIGVGATTAPLVRALRRPRPAADLGLLTRQCQEGGAEAALMGWSGGAAYLALLSGALVSTGTFGLLAGVAWLAAGLANLLVFPAVIAAVSRR